VICPLNVTATHVSALLNEGQAAAAACVAAGGVPPAGFTNVVLAETALP
jgi:hypothetical protein